MGTTPDGASDGFTEEPIYATPPPAAAPAVAAPAAPPPDITVGTGLNGEVTQSDIEAAQRDAAARAESSNPTGPAGSAGDRSPGDATGSASANRPSNVTQGTATQTTGSRDSASSGSATTNPSASTAPKSFTLSSVQPNPLAGFTSYNALWTLACLTPDQFNQPQSYRDNDSALQNVVLSSGGYLDSKRVKTAYGSPEYFIQNFEMTSIIVPMDPNGGSGNTVTFKFQIFEPQSLGLFMQSIQAAAINSGYVNYLNNAAYVLKLEFVGWDVNGAQKRIPGATRYFPIKFVTLKFSVTESGSTYDIVAIPYNHTGFSNVVDVTLKDLKISGATVKDILAEGETSLAVALTKSSEILQKNGLIGVKDTFVVTFPTDDSGNTRADNAGSATVDPNASGGTSVGSSTGGGGGDNPIGQASMGFDMNSGGTTEPGREVDAYNKDGMIDKTKVTIDPKSRTFTFAQGQKITDIITQVVLASDYAKKAVTGSINSDGTVNWFKVDVQIKLVEFDPNRNDYSKIFAFRVIPYKVHSSIFQKPTVSAQGTEQLKTKINKRYDYIYTGKNEDLLRFDLNFNTLFYTAISPAPPEAGSQRDAAQNKASNDAVSKVAVPAAGNAAALAAAGGAKRVIPSLEGAVYPPGGAAADDVAAAVARDFHNAFLNQIGDLLTIEAEILGDPYFILNSGLGNYFSAPSGGAVADGSMAYEGQEVYVYFAFRNPIDIQVNGPLYQFPNGGTLSPFSGIYKVQQVVSTFREGTFVQKVKAYRIQGQPEDEPNGRITVNQAKDKVMPFEATGKVDAAAETNPNNPDAPQ